MESECVHKGCEKELTDPKEACVYLPSPPVCHEEQKGMGCNFQFNLHS